MMSKADALNLYRKLLLARLSEEKIREVYASNDLKTPVHLGIGGEAIPIGIGHCLPPDTGYFGTYRNHTLYLMLTGDTDSFFGELYGRVTGPGRGKAGSMHLTAPEKGLLCTSAVVATTIPTAVGAALAAKYRGSEQWTVVTFGDGAMEEGVFFESVNFACLHQLRVLFVCEDNDLAIHSQGRERRGHKSIQQAVQAFDCHCSSGDGTDLLEVIRHTEAVKTAMLSQPKPGFLHFTYLRYLEHVGPNEDFDVGYRQRPSPEEKIQRDPVANFQKHLATLNCESEVKQIQTEVKAQIEASVKKAQAAPFPAPEELFTDVFAD